MKFVVATNNQHKLEELREILGASGHTLLSLGESGFSGEIIEDGDSFEANARIKAQTVCKATGLPAIADDSGICVDALDGAPASIPRGTARRSARATLTAASYCCAIWRGRAIATLTSHAR